MHTTQRTFTDCVDTIKMQKKKQTKKKVKKSKTAGSPSDNSIVRQIFTMPQKVGNAI